MAGRDDEHDDDQLKSLRAVWLEMRDEDPPSGGLDALMAAAHSQAKVMGATAKPPWWKVLVRPPVLAFASVALVVGGVWLIGHHDTRALVEVPSTPGDSATLPVPPAVQRVEPPPPPPPPSIVKKPITSPMEHAQRDAAGGARAPELDAATPGAVLVDRLETQVEGAVTRGDCETAKAIAARIARQDNSYYAAHTAAAIKSCL